jgi:hypothetical protein
MRHYCTYFDSGFLSQGLALWSSLRRHDPAAQLWVLALDEAAIAMLRRLTEPGLHVVPLAELEAGDPSLAAAKANRSRVEYYFTLSPCWPSWLLQSRPEIEAITYLDADLWFWSSPQPFFTEVAAAGASVGITAHRYPPALRSLEKWGRYNVGIQYFRRDAAGLAVLADWRARCLEWCHDRLEPERFADQKYLDAWPTRFGKAVRVVTHPGVNVAPWNWVGHAWETEGETPTVDGQPLVFFHYAKFRPINRLVWDSGQLDFAVMPRRLRVALYEPYWRALRDAAERASSGGPALASRGVRSGFKKWLLRLLFGSSWWRAGGLWLALGLGPLGRKSGAWLCRWREGDAA